MYGRTFAGSLRTRQQWRAAVLLVAGVAVGVSLAHLGAAPRILVAAETAFAVVASLLELRAALSRAGHRVAGTYAGLVLTAALLSLGLSPSLTALAMMALLFPTELFMTRNYAVAIGFFTPLIMLMTELGTPTGPVELLVARGLDTLIGVAAGLAAALLVRGRAYGWLTGSGSGSSSESRAPGLSTKSSSST